MSKCHTAYQSEGPANVLSALHTLEILDTVPSAPKYRASTTDSNSAESETYLNVEMLIRFLLKFARRYMLHLDRFLSDR